MPSYTINNAQKRGILHFSNSYNYKSIKELGIQFIKGKIKLTDFISNYKGYTNVSDATLLKRTGNKIHGAKKLKNYVTKSYGILQDLLIIVERINGLNYIIDFKIINHNKKHLTKQEELEKAIKSGEIRKNSWLIFDGGLKSSDLLKVAREYAIKLTTRLNTNFVVSFFGRKYRKEDIFRTVKPIKRTIYGKIYVIYPLNRCIWNKVAGNLFLVKGEDYEDFIPLFTIYLKCKPETAIKKYLERPSIEQTNKDSKSYLEIEASYFRKKESNYGDLFVKFMIYNFIQNLRPKLSDMSFKDVSENLYLYLLWKYPPKCVFEMDKLLSDFDNDMDLNYLNQLNNDLISSDWLIELHKSLNMAECCV